MFWHNHHKGEIATTLTLVTILVLTVGIFAGTQLSQQNTDTRSRAASSSGDGFLVCDSGSDPYNSNTIVVTNKTSQTISNIQSVSFSCKYEPGRIRKGFYKCETCTDSDEVGNPDCQVGIHDPLRSAEFTLAPGDTKTITVNANACEIVQFDVYNPIDQGESPTECYNIGSNYINPGQPNWWPGGIGFGINENASCSSGGYVPPGSNPTPTPTQSQTAPTATRTPTPTPLSCRTAFTNGECKSRTSCLGPSFEVKGDYGCTAPGAGDIICCAPASSTLNQTCGQGAYTGATCKAKSDCLGPLYRDVGDQGCNFPGTASLTCCLPVATPTPTPLASEFFTSVCTAQNPLARCTFKSVCTPDKNWNVIGDFGCSSRGSTYGCCAPTNQPTSTPTQTSQASLSCANLITTRIPGTNSIAVVFKMPGTSLLEGWRSVTLNNVPQGSEFTFAQIGLEGDTTCRVTN